MNSSIKTVLWELFVVLSFGFCMLSETFLFVGVVPACIFKGEEISLICIIIACCVEVISLVLCVTAICICNRKEVQHRIWTDVCILFNMLMTGKNIYMLLSQILVV